MTNDERSPSRCWRRHAGREIVLGDLDGSLRQSGVSAVFCRTDIGIMAVSLSRHPCRRAVRCHAGFQAGVHPACAGMTVEALRARFHRFNVRSAKAGIDATRGPSATLPHLPTPRRAHSAAAWVSFRMVSPGLTIVNSTGASSSRVCRPRDVTACRCSSPDLPFWESLLGNCAPRLSVRSSAASVTTRDTPPAIAGSTSRAR